MSASSWLVRCEQSLRAEWLTQHIDMDPQGRGHISTMIVFETLPQPSPSCTNVSLGMWTTPQLQLDVDENACKWGPRNKQGHR
jgi:hypothetical protein